MSLAAGDKCPTCGGALRKRGTRSVCPRCLLAGTVEESASEISASDPPSRIDAPPATALASVFPDLTITRLIGAGGMGIVYHAKQKALERSVALKLLRLDSANPEFAERFEREAKTLAKLDHPNIVRIIDQGEREGWVFILMEYVEGTDLSKLLERGKLEPVGALEIADSVCAALEYAHGEGIVHRDIKPANILIDHDGTVKIADFGLAKLIGPEPQSFTLTTGGSSMGTPLYMAPEQRKSSADADARADIYSAGVVLYEMLTGELPMGRFKAPSELVPVPRAVDRAILKAIEPKPSARHETVSAFRSALAKPPLAPRRRVAWAGATCAALGAAAWFASPPTDRADDKPPPQPELQFPPPVLLTSKDAVTIREPSPTADSYFGTLIDARGSTLVVGTPNENVLDLGDSASGEVFVYEIDRDGEHNEPRLLTAVEPQKGDLFGGNLAISPDGLTIAIAASGWRRADDVLGIVEIYSRPSTGAAWEHTQTIDDFPATFAESKWGLRVNLHNTTLAVGSTGFQKRGACRIYQHQGGGRWQFDTMLLGPATEPRMKFGAWCAIDAKTGGVVVSSTLTDFLAESADLHTLTPFTRDADGSWQRRPIMRPPTSSDIGLFGSEPAIVGDSLFTGYAGYSKDGIDGAGAMMHYVRDPSHESGWRLRDTITLPLEKPTLTGFGGRIVAKEDRVAALSLRRSSSGRSSVTSIARPRAGGRWEIFAEISSEGHLVPWPGRIVLGDHFFATSSSFILSAAGDENAGAVYLFPNKLFEPPNPGDS